MPIPPRSRASCGTSSGGRQADARALNLDRRQRRVRHRAAPRQRILDEPSALGTRLHEVSYRACFKPQLPRFFVDRLTRPATGLRPVLGRGTTPIEAALLGRIPGATQPAVRGAPRAAVEPPAPGRYRRAAQRDSVRWRRGPRTICAFLPSGHASARSGASQCLLAASRAARSTLSTVDPHGRDQPADRPLARLLLGLHATAKPGGLSRAQRQRSTPARAAATAPRRACLIVRKSRSLLALSPSRAAARSTRSAPGS